MLAVARRVGDRGLAGRHRAAVHRLARRTRSPAPRRSTPRGCARASATCSTTRRRSARSSLASPTVLPRRGRVPRQGRPRRHPAGGRPQRDRRRRAGDRRDAARPDRRRDDRQRRLDRTAASGPPTWCRPLPPRCRGALARRDARRDGGGRDRRRTARRRQPASRVRRRRRRRADVRRLHVRPSAPELVAAEAALRACGYAPSRIVSGGGSDANALQARASRALNLANGTERNHEPTERVSVAALEGMLDVALALLDEAAAAEQPLSRRRFRDRVEGGFFTVPRTHSATRTARRSPRDDRRADAGAVGDRGARRRGPVARAPAA